MSEEPDLDGAEAALVDALVGSTLDGASAAELERDELKEKVAKLKRETAELEKTLADEQTKRQEADKERDELKGVVQQLMHASKGPGSPKKGAPSPKKGAPAPAFVEEAAAAEEEEEDPQAAHQARMDATNALRTAAMAGDVGQLKIAIEKAESLGLEFEAATAKRRLAKLEA
jgi:hypothetical protein